MQHKPVLLKEVVQCFKEIKIQIFLDATVGAGGHAKEILQDHPEIKRYIAIDRDKTALEIAKKKLNRWKEKIMFFQENFLFLDRYLKDRCADGILFDLGVSSMQLEEGERGFSFKREGPLDMRMDRSKELTAEKVINDFSRKELEKIFRDYAEEPKWKKALNSILSIRKKKRIKTTLELADILKKICVKKRHLHPATRIFQGIRIYVNNELDSLKVALSKAIDHLCDKGKIAVISFHSLEDRIVKRIFKENKEMVNELIKPSYEEKRVNRRARSSKLRILKKEMV